MALLVAPAPGAQGASTVKACVKKKTGTVLFVKKCKKGWKRVIWSRQGDPGAIGPQGQQGPQGDKGADATPLQVRSSDGTLLGRYAGVLFGGLFYTYVLRDGGIYLYGPDGKVVPTLTPVFKSATCQSPAYIQAGSQAALYTGSAGGPTRLVYRPSTPPGPSRAFELTSQSEAVNQVLYVLNGAGVCTATGVLNTTLVQLQEVAAPPDATPPLKVA
jgi:hypothetical protein